MPAYPDDFDRADGPLGAGWDVLGGSAAIVSGAAHLEGNTLVQAVGQSEPADLDHYLVIQTGVGRTGDVGIRYRWTGSNPVGFRALLSQDSGDDHVLLDQRIGSNWITTNNVSVDVSGQASATLRLTVIGDVHTIYLDGVQKIQETITQSDPGGAWFLDNPSGTSDVLSVDTTEAPTETMQITPDPLWVGGGPCLVTATGTGTDWSDGGSPSTTFSADHGEVAVYRWVSATEWELVYTPAEYIGTITFSETQYGLSDQVNGVLTPPVEGSNGLCQLTPAGAEIINLAGERREGAEIITDQSIVIPAAGGATDVHTLDALRDIWQATIWTNPPVVPNPITQMIYWILWSTNFSGDDVAGPWLNIRTEPLQETAGLILKQFWNPVEGVYVDTPQLLDAIDAISAPDLSAIRADLGIEGQMLYVSILEAIRSTRGDDVSSILGILSELGYIRSAHAYTLESVMDAIAAIPAADVQAVLDKLNVIQPDEDDDLSTITSDIASVNTIVSGIATSLGQYRTGSNYTVQDILDRLDDIEAKIDAIDTGGAPVWPGLANVSMGAPVALVDQLVLNGPMDGVIVAVTTPPVGLGQYRVGGRRLDYGQMRLAFETDNGELEGWQYFGFEEAVYTPHAMAQAAKCRFQLLGGLGGTVTPWTRS